MMKAFDTRPTYRIFAVACTITGLLYFLFNKFYLRKRPQVRIHLCSFVLSCKSFVTRMVKSNGLLRALLFFSSAERCRSHHAGRRHMNNNCMEKMSL
jgi:hypothetical protein